MNVLWTPEALADLAEIEAVGRAKSEMFLSRAAQIEFFPESGRVVPEYGLTVIRELIERPYRIIYELFADRIEVIAVINGARDIRAD